MADQFGEFGGEPLTELLRLRIFIADCRATWGKAIPAVAAPNRARYAYVGSRSSGSSPASCRRYEAEMRGYGFAAVRDSIKAARQVVGGSRFARAGFKTFLRTARRFPALRDRVFA